MEPSQIPYSPNLQRGAVCMAILSGDGKILVSRRPKHMRKFPLAWVLPGGHMEKNETFEQSVIREVYEETGIRISQDSQNPNLLKNNKTYCHYNGAPCILELFFLFESVSFLTFGTNPPTRGHLIVFYKI